MGKKSAIQSRYRGNVMGMSESDLKRAYDEFKSVFGKAPDSVIVSADAYAGWSMDFHRPITEDDFTLITHYLEGSIDEVDLDDPKMEGVTYDEVYEDAGDPKFRFEEYSEYPQAYRDNSWEPMYDPVGWFAGESSLEMEPGFDDGEKSHEEMLADLKSQLSTGITNSKDSSIVSEKYWFLDRFDKPKAYQNLTKDELISKIKETLHPLKNETDEQWVLNPDWDSLGADADVVSWGRMGHGNENGAGNLSWEEVREYLKNSKENNMRKFAIKSARGEVSDSTRQLVRDILAQVPALVKVPAKQQGIKKEPYGPDHVCYFYTEEGPRKGSYVTVEFHVDPNDLYTDIFITTRASFAAAAEGGEARQDEREVTLDEFVIEDLEDYSLADIDKIDAAVTKGFEGAQKFDEQAASTIESRKALFSSKHKQFISSGRKRISSGYSAMADVAWEEMTDAWKSGYPCAALDECMDKVGSVDYVEVLEYDPELHLRVLKCWEEMTGGELGA